MQEYRKSQLKGDNFGQAIKHTTFYYLKRMVFSGMFVTALLVLSQIALMIVMFAWLSNYAHFYFEGSALLCAVCIIIIMNEDSNPAYKMTWIVPVALFPIVGSLMYLYVKYNTGTRAPKKTLKQIIKKTKGYTYTGKNVKEEIKNLPTSFQKLSYYLEETGGFATYKDTATNYYSLGDDAMEDILSCLKEAKEYIFMEFFMVEEGIFYNSVLEILEQKVKEGVEVRFMYDDIGCALLLPRNYPKKLREKGIHVRTFAHIKPFFSTHYNNRDHRKIIVVDGKVAITGGINLCDEYVNVYEKFGHWKDNVLIMRGSAVAGFTMLFLQMWHASNYETDAEYAKFLRKNPEKEGTTGYVIPYGDGPYQKDCLAEHVYMDIINHAKKYVYIMTPYLILDHELVLAISHAARCGVDVRIILPHIPDKKVPFAIARSYYEELLAVGVKIYEYKPGFIHSKTFLSDDIIGTVGSINLDYRSLYLHYECGAILYQNDALKDIRKDFEETFKKSIEVDLTYYKSIPWVKRFWGRVLRIFGPLM